MDPQDVLNDEFCAKVEALLNTNINDATDSTGALLWSKASSKDPSIQAFSAPAPEWTGSKLRVYRLETSMIASMVKITDLLHTNMIEKHHEWNKSFDRAGSRYVQRYDDNLSVQLWRYTLPIFIHNREFLVARRKIEKEDGTLILIERSMEISGIIPPDNFVRSECYFQIRQFKPLPEASVRFSSMNLTDLKGSFPNWLQNMANHEYSIEEAQNIVNLVKTDLPETYLSQKSA